MAPIPTNLAPLNTEYQDVITFQTGLTQENKVPDLGGTAWHTSAWTEILNPLSRITVEYHYKINLDEIKNKKSYTSLSLLNAYLKAAQSKGGVIMSADTKAKFLLDGTPFGNEVTLQPGGYPTFTDNSLAISGDVFANHLLEIIITINLGVQIPSWIDWYFGALTVNFQGETPLTFYNVHVACQISGQSLGGIRVQIGDDVKNTDMTGRAGPFKLTSGSYTAYANATKGSDSYSGNVKFDVPVAQDPSITLTIPFQLPWWWWTIPVGVGAVAVLYLLRGRGRREPPIYVIK